MNNPLKALLGSRVMPITLPKSSLNPITHIELVTLAIEVSAVQKHNEAIQQAASQAAARLSLQSFGGGGFGTGTPAAGAGAWGAAGGGVAGGGIAGGTSGGGYVAIPEGPDTDVPESEFDADVGLPAAEEFASDEDLNSARVGAGVYYALPVDTSVQTGTAAQYESGYGASQAVKPITPGAVAPTFSATPSFVAVTRTVIDAIAGSVYFQLLNRGRAPLKMSAVINGRFGDFELFNTSIQKMLPPSRKPVKFKADYAFEGDDAGLFARALMTEAGPTSKATLVLDALLRWNAFTHKITDARTVDAVIAENITL